MTRIDPSFAELKRLQQHKQSAPQDMPHLGPEMLSFFRQSVQKRQSKLAAISDAWSHLVPAMLCNHCALESFTRGTLTVLVDSSSHLYELKQLLLAGLQDQLLIACRSPGLRKITLRHGRWYDGDATPDRRPSFNRQ
jgi:hypothetical protein